jgi:hypothetical protein
MANPDAPPPAESPALTPEKVTPEQLADDWRILRERKWDWHDQNLTVRPFVDSLMTRLASVSRRLAALEGEKWQPIETAPKDGTKLLLVCADGWYFVGQWSDRANGHMNWNDGEYTFGNLTHWQPLPPPPADALARLQQERP